jgi:hypothetical protein
MCCCLNCPLYANQPGFSKLCILQTAQQHPALSGYHAVFCHWYDFPAVLVRQKKCLFLHGLGQDSFEKLMDDDAHAEFEKLPKTTAEERLQQINYIYSKLSEQKVLRIVFDGNEEWDETKSDCVEFHQKVNVLNAFCSKMSIITVFSQIYSYTSSVNLSKAKVGSPFSVCPVSRLRLTCLMLACRFFF